MRFTSLKLNSLRDLLLEELRDLYNAEQQLIETLPISQSGTDLIAGSALGFGIRSSFR